MGVYPWLGSSYVCCLLAERTVPGAGTMGDYHLHQSLVYCRQGGNHRSCPPYYDDFGAEHYAPLSRSSPPSPANLACPRRCRIVWRLAGYEEEN
ncbi:unnamed protein product [Victoria cruziana]